MTVANQIKILDKKIFKMKHSMVQTENQLKYLHFFSNKFDKYEYLTGEDLGLKPSTVKQAIYAYSLLSKFLNKGLKEIEKKKVH